MSSRQFLALTTLVLCGVARVEAQPTNIAIGSTLQPSVKRLGINLGYQTFYDSGMMTKNLISRNPGFEGEIYQSTIRCASGTATACVDDNPYSAWPDGFWNGASVEFFFGSAKGRVGTVSAYNRANGSTGGRFTFSGSGTVPALGDYFIVRKTSAGTASSGWWPVVTGSASIATNFTDLPPGTAGKQTVALSAPGANDVATLGAYFDSTAGKSFLAMRGTYQLSFKAKGTGGANVVALNIQRAGLPAYLTQNVALTNAWNTYNVTFSASDPAGVVGTVGVLIATRGVDSFLLDDVSLTQLNTDPSNTTVFRDPVVNTLKTLSPGVLRHWANQLGDTLDNMISPQYARQRAGFSAWTTTQEDVSFSLHEFLQLCEAVGAEPWLVVPITFSTTDAANLIEYLSGPASTPYGAKRAALGRSNTWVSAFTKIHLEFGNEAWNGGFKGGVIEYSAPYGQRAQGIFAAMRSNSYYGPSSYNLVLGGQAAWPDRNKDIQNNCNNNDTLALAPYMMNRVDSFSSHEELFGSTYAEAEAFHVESGTSEGVANGLMLQNLKALQASNRPVPIALYEMNLSTLDGAIPQSALDNYAPALGSGLAVVDAMLQSMRKGVIYQNLFALQQYRYLRSDNKTVPLWGSVVDMGLTDRRRPQFLALQLANAAIGANATMLQTAHSGADPTWNQPLVNSVQLNGAHYLQSFAFSSSSQRSLVVFNLHRTSSLPLTFIGANAPFGSVKLQQLTSASPADTNEDLAKVNIASQTLSSFNAATGMSVPPNSMTVLTWNAGTSPSPVISGVSVSSLTGNSATITWTTNEPSTTRVQYGATPAYGLASNLDSTLLTSHSAVLTGLQPGATYNYFVESANGLGLLSASPNLTFTTPTTGPIISAVSASNISGTSATIVWTTDKPSTTQVAYGTTTAYGSLTALNSTLLTAHSATLTGLTPGATYHYAVISSLSTGSTTSTNFTFTTPATGLVISNVQATGLTPTSATITWITDKPATTMALYGTTTAYGSYSTYDATLLTSHAVTISGLAPNTNYNYAVTSISASGTLTSSNYTFTTPGAIPIITSVTATPISGTSATITWTTDRPSTSQAVYGTTNAYGSYSTFDATLVTQHSVTLNGLTPGVTYNYAVSSVASTGTGTSGNFTFTATNSVSTFSSISASGITSTSATITWATDKPSTSQVLYGTTTAYSSASNYDSTLVTWHTVALTGLSPNTTYNYAVRSYSTAGVATSTNFTFTTGGAAPVISAISATGITATSATIVWTTDFASSSQVFYGTTTALGSSSTFAATAVTFHSLTLSGLSPGTTYYYTVSSASSAGTRTSAVQSFSTPGSAPIVSSVSASAITSTSAVITWATNQPATSQVLYGPTSAYGLYSNYDSTLLTWHTITLTGLNPNQTYNYAVKSLGVTGTVVSANFSFSTTGAAPTITSISVTNVTRTSATINWTTDLPSTTQVSYRPVGATYTMTSAYLATPVTSHTAILTGLTPGTAYSYSPMSTGSVGITATSSPATFATAP